MTTIDLTTTDLSAKTAVELRKLGAAFGIKGAHSGRKAELLPALEAIQDKQREAKEQAAKAKPARPGRVTCVICHKRPGMSAAQRRYQGVGADFADQCEPCHIEAGWENSHSDNSHAELAATPEGQIPSNWGFSSDSTEEQKLASVALLRQEAEQCWICHPELNRASAEYTPRTGTSRSGMVMNVKQKMTGAEKATLVSEKLGAKYATRIDTSEKGLVKLLLTHAGTVSFTLVWDVQGHYLYEQSKLTLNGSKPRKVRNVAELLRTLA